MSKIDRGSDEAPTELRAHPGTPRVALFMRVALFNLLLALVSMAVILWIVRAEKGLAGRIADYRESRARECASTRVIKSQAPVLVDPEGKVPPQDAPRTGYFGRNGADISAVMRLTVESLRAGELDRDPRRLRLGSQQALPSGTIHIVNLWATWCGPCTEELPELQALFARRSDWRHDVRFVPITLKDHTDPGRAYQQHHDIMPPAPVMLADRSENEALVGILSADAQRLFHGDLPVTLVLDCNRRVRWAQFAALSRQGLVDLESNVDRLRAELADEGPLARCSQEWCGNGRCEGFEDTTAAHCPEDCGPLRRIAEAAEAPEEPAPEACPEGMIRTATGQCSRKLRGMPASEKSEPPVEQATTCGNGICDAGENSESCCQDCGCAKSRTCRRDGQGDFKCLGGLKGVERPAGAEE